MKNTKPRFCPQCGAAIAPGSLQGLCPNCLALVAFSADPSEEQTVLSSRSTLDASPAGHPPEARPLISAGVRYFGNYELLGEIARGGMGVVHKARQVKLNRTVAVKMILSGKFAAAADVQRFHTEAEAAANLQHPHIVAIHEVGEHEGHHYFSMDYVEGQNLAEYVRETPLPPSRAAELTRTIAEAVHYAHQRGTLHRDLKPQNVLMDASGQPRLTDFGLAKRLVVLPSGSSVASGPAEAGTPCGLTQTGAVMGSPSYMPPEQAAGRNECVGPASDVYSIGALLYHLLTGRAPFLAETPLATLRKVMEEEPVAPSKLNPRTPSDLETICLKCLEKKPERRYASARALAEELGRFLNHEPIQARPASPLRKAWSWSLRHPWIITAAASALILGLVGFAYTLQQENAFLKWSRTHPGETPLYTPRWFESDLMQIFLFVTAPFLPLLPWIDFMVRRLRADPIRRPHLIMYSVIGVSQVLLGILVLMAHIEAKAWHFDSPFNGTSAMVGSLYLTALGTLLLWEVVRECFSTSSGCNVPELLESNSRPQSRIGELFVSLGVSSKDWNLAPLAILLLGGPIWLLISPTVHLPDHGAWITVKALSMAIPMAAAICAAANRSVRPFWILAFVALAAIAIYPDAGSESRWSTRRAIWFPLMLTAPEVPVVLALSGTTKGAARLFWILGVWPIAAMSTMADFRIERWLSTESWLFATAGGLVLIKLCRRSGTVESPVPKAPGTRDANLFGKALEESRWHAATEFAAFLTAWVCLATFYSLMVPERYGSRDWFSVVVGPACLPAAAWCLSLRTPRPAIVVLLALITLSGTWILFASPYAI